MSRKLKQGFPSLVCNPVSSKATYSLLSCAVIRDSIKTLWNVEQIRFRRRLLTYISCLVISCPAFSCPAISCLAILMVRHFHVRHFQRPRLPIARIYSVHRYACQEFKMHVNSKTIESRSNIGLMNSIASKCQLMHKSDDVYTVRHSSVALVIDNTQLDFALRFFRSLVRKRKNKSKLRLQRQSAATCYYRNTFTSLAELCEQVLRKMHIHIIGNILYLC